jgi:hypothetical protein
VFSYLAFAKERPSARGASLRFADSSKPSMSRPLLIAVLLSAPVLTAQVIAPYATYGAIRTPQIRLGSNTTPSIINVPPVVEVSGVEGFDVPADSQVSNAPPASTELLATRHFDFVVSPLESVFSPQGNMADSSISLGEYARQLRALKHAAPAQALPDEMAPPAKPR